MNASRVLESVALLLVLSSTDLSLAGGPTETQSLDDWMNAELTSAVLTRLDVRQGTRQSEPSSKQDSATTLVDKSSASALIGMGMNLSGLSAGGNGEAQADSLSVTASAYSLLAAARGEDALNPSFYNAHPDWRRLYLTLGYDNPQGGNAADQQQSKIAGLKYLVVDRRNPSHYQKEINDLAKRLAPAGLSYGDMRARILSRVETDPRVVEKLFRPIIREELSSEKQVERDSSHIKDLDSWLERAEPELAIVRNALGYPNFPRYSIDQGVCPAFPNALAKFENKYLLGGDFASVWATLTDESRADIGALFSQESPGSRAFEELEAQALALLGKMRRAPQLSISAVSKRVADGPDDFSLEVIFDYGIKDRIDLTANAAYEYTNSPVVGADKRGGSAALNFDFIPGAIHVLEGKDAMKLSVSAMGCWMSGSDAEYKAQAKLTLPVADGISFPISVTYANRTNEVDEQTVRGQFGFSVDVARIMSGFAGR